MSAWSWPNLPYIVKFNFQYLTLYLSDVEKAEVIAHLKGLWDALVEAGVPFKAHWGKINFNTPPAVAKNLRSGGLPAQREAYVHERLSSRAAGKLMAGRTEERSLRPATSRDCEALADTLALAFFDDPVMRWMIPDDSRRRARLPRFFSFIFGTEPETGFVLTAPEGRATSFWRPPGTAGTSLTDSLARAFPMLGVFGAGIGRALAVSGAIEAHHPKQPFWYAHFVGVRPDAQGEGWGSMMMREGCERARAEGLPVYLETARQRNVDFYAARGFSVTGEFDVPGGPHFWSMINQG